MDTQALLGVNLDRRHAVPLYYGMCHVDNNSDSERSQIDFNYFSINHQDQHFFGKFQQIQIQMKTNEFFYINYTRVYYYIFTILVLGKHFHIALNI